MTLPCKSMTNSSNGSSGASFNVLSYLVDYALPQSLWLLVKSSVCASEASLLVHLTAVAWPGGSLGLSGGLTESVNSQLVMGIRPIITTGTRINCLLNILFNQLWFRNRPESSCVSTISLHGA